MPFKHFIFSVLLSLAILMPSIASAGDMTLVQKFSAQDGAVDFLPGAWISLSEQGKPTYYRYSGGKFVKADKLPDYLRGWKSHSNDVDYLDQIARKDFDPGIDYDLPRLSKVKKVIEISNAGHGVAYVCYSLLATDKDARPDTTDIYLAIFASADTKSGPTYKLLKTLKLESEVSYGGVDIQKIEGVGSLLLFYWGEPTGDSSIDGLDVYKIEIKN